MHGQACLAQTYGVSTSLKASESVFNQRRARPAPMVLLPAVYARLARVIPSAMNRSDRQFGADLFPDPK